MDEETWLTATECEEYGFCDVVEEEKQLVASIDKTLLTRYKNTPREFLDKPKPDDDKENKILKQKLLMELEL
jgi:ATP-dependent Clp protease protease subunit